MSEADYAKKRRAMVNRFVREGVIKSEAVKRAFLIVPRELFVWKGSETSAYADSPQPLGVTDQTISAPHMIAIMLEELDLKPGMNVLEVGAGSGYTSALISEIIASAKKELERNGHVTSVESLGELVQFASENLERTGYSSAVTVVSGDGTLGYPEKSREEIYDRIIVTAAAPHIPVYLQMQLKKGGVLLIPVGNPLEQVLLRVSKSEAGEITSRSVTECMFVPLIGEDGFH
ncbi:MAG: protein-L-isoaspartate(D-aspartate) O-methyltransferase [Thaumarchaeota archaeon]|nr:protein-L-isoaspartate(D-aspartate) O-methyltransferase [Nitrososphaerota archaeon]MCL5316826.1 protein-L-isoaspartate(D-aspartate) O-methyltransferase [Nitrososphaerota archaeon]